MELLRKFAEVICKIGVNINEGQIVVIKSPVECVEFTRILVEEAYKNKASKVMIDWRDEVIQKSFLNNASDDVLQEVPDYLIDMYHYIVDKKACFISVSSPMPGVMKDVDPKKAMLYGVALSKKTEFYSKVTMASLVQWCVVSYPTKFWAKKVFPDLSEDEAFNKLLDEILKASRITKDNDPILEWKEHIAKLDKRAEILNKHNFKELYFKNELGTDLHVGLACDHIWCAANEYSKNNTNFIPNMPTEEVFSMPSKYEVNGRVYSTKPLNYQGKLVKEFYLDFKDGKVVGFDAKEGYDALNNLINYDEGSSYLGEVALISYDSPISNSKILFYNTLFDENASCHLALGDSYPTNIKNGVSMTDEERQKKGSNKSMEHVDFMFGDSTLEVTGITYDGKEVKIFEKGNFIF